MVARALILLFALACLAIALGVSAESLALFVNPQVRPRLLPQALAGASILKTFLLVDALALAGLALFARRVNQWGFTSRFQSQWSAAPDEPAVDGWLERNYQVLLLALMALAGALRFWGLGNDLWMDEVFSLVGAGRSSPGQIISLYTDDNHHTLFVLLARISTAAFGESAFSFRLPSALFGIASIWAVAHLGRLVFNRRTAILAAALLTLMYQHVWFSQNARGYTILLFCTVVASYLFLMGLQSGRWRYWVCYALVVALGSFAHLTGIFVGLGHGLVLLMLLARDRSLSNGRWRPWAALALSAWFTLHFYALMLPQLLGHFLKFSQQPKFHFEWQSPAWLIAEAFEQIGIGLLAGWAGLFVMIPVGVYLFSLFVRRDWVFVALALSPAVVTIAGILLVGWNLWPRMFFNELGFAALFATAAAIYFGLLALRLLPRLPAGAALVPALVLCAAAALKLPDVYKYPKQDYTGARDYVLSQLGTGDVVLGLHMAGKVYKSYYAPDWPEINTLRELEARSAHSGYTWVLYTLPRFLQSAKPAIISKFESEFDVMETFPGTLAEGSIIVVRSKMPASEAGSFPAASRDD